MDGDLHAVALSYCPKAVELVRETLMHFAVDRPGKILCRRCLIGAVIAESRASEVPRHDRAGAQFSQKLCVAFERIVCDAFGCRIDQGVADELAPMRIT